MNIKNKSGIYRAVVQCGMNVDIFHDGSWSEYTGSRAEPNVISTLKYPYCYYLSLKKFTEILTEIEKG